MPHRIWATQAELVAVAVVVARWPQGPVMSTSVFAKVEWGIAAAGATETGLAWHRGLSSRCARAT